ncbi:MAG: class I SAM-dependent methyltransferase [Planctomycetota bacterium]
MTVTEADLIRLLGGVDVYLLDQILKGRFDPATTRVLDAGCGHGRNVAYFLAMGYPRVAGIDQSSDAVSAVKQLAHRHGRDPEPFCVANVEDAADLFGAAAFDLVISNAVLHFANSHAHFDRMLDSMWHTLAPGGLFFARLATSIGLPEASRRPLDGEGQVKLGDGSRRHVVSLEQILAQTERIGGTLLEPVKSMNVQNLRSMGVWVVRKPA